MSFMTRQEAEQFRKLARAIDAQRLREAIQAAAATGAVALTGPGAENGTGPPVHVSDDADLDPDPGHELYRMRGPGPDAAGSLNRNPGTWNQLAPDRLTGTEKLYPAGARPCKPGPEKLDRPGRVNLEAGPAETAGDGAR